LETIMRFVFPLLALALAAQLSNSSVRAEEPVAPPKPPDAAAPAPNPAPNAGDNNNAGGRGRTRGNWGGNNGGGMPGGMPGGIGAMLGGGGRGLDVSAVARMAGIDYRDPTAEPKVEQLPLAANLRIVTEIPVGGVDNFAAPGKAGRSRTSSR
jgi:hypothetical protein